MSKTSDKLSMQLTSFISIIWCSVKDITS